MDAQTIIQQLKIEEEVIAIFPYGSRVYLTHNEYSDHDFVIVAKPAVLNSGAFRNNAVSNEDYTIQGTLYSRAGFTDAINNYDMPAMECLSLSPDQVLLKKWPFKIQKWDAKEMVKKVIEKASASRHIADQQAKSDYRDRAQKGMFHALRILTFGSQLKEHQKIVDFSACNELYREIMAIDEDEFDTRSYYGLFDQLKKDLES